MNARQPLPASIGEILRRMSESPTASPSMRLALRKALTLADIAEAAVDASAQDRVEHHRRGQRA